MAVNRGRRGKYEVAYLLRDGALKKRLARNSVVAIIFERIARTDSGAIVELAK